MASPSPPADGNELQLVFADHSEDEATESLVARLTPLGLSGTAYVGYPILPLPSGPHAIDLLLTCREHGLVAFDLVLGASQMPPDAVIARQRELRQALEQALARSARLMLGGKLIISVRVLTLDPSEAPISSIENEPAAAPVVAPSNSPDGRTFITRPAVPSGGTNAGGVGSEATLVGRDLVDSLKRSKPIDAATLRFVDAAIQRLGAIHFGGVSLGSLAGRRAERVADIQSRMTTLDRWQKWAAIETPRGPQRIRGLAGTGKTVVLAFKAAMLHAARPDRRIAVTFFTRTLYEPLQALVRRFHLEHAGREPNWDNLLIRHAWGASRKPGIYREVTARLDIPFEDLGSAKRAYNNSRIFEQACATVLRKLGQNDPDPIYDAVLIDEFQDLPASFLEMVYRVTAPPKRVIWAYDDLQNLSEYVPTPPAKLFGSKSDGTPRVPALIHEEGQPRPDIILPICYRNPPWTLSLAHALGLGIYRRPAGGEATGLVQSYDDPEVWKDLGYLVAEGSLTPGETVTLARDPARSPDFFEKILDREDSVQCHRFASVGDEYAWVAKQVRSNLEAEGLTPRDVLIVSANPFYKPQDDVELLRALTKENVPSFVAGADGQVDRLFGSGDSVPIAHINRAKGNEAWMVYVIHSDKCGERSGDIMTRNMFFTAITRSKAWVRITGAGAPMKVIEQEVRDVIANDYTLRFRVPTAQELGLKPRHQRDVSPSVGRRHRKMPRT